MSISTIIIFVAIIGIISGAIRPWLGIVAGFIAFPALFCIFRSTDIIYLIVTALAGAIISGIAGFVSSIFFSGMKGKGHNTGPNFMSGFGGGRGGGPPGGIILSDEERQRNKK